ALLRPLGQRHRTTSRPSSHHRWTAAIATTLIIVAQFPRKRIFMTLPIDTEQLAHILRDAARTEILPRFRRLQPGDIKTKSSAVDLVTEADIHAERVITAEIAKRWPQALVVGEEAASADPALLS